MHSKVSPGFMSMDDLLGRTNKQKGFKTPPNGGIVGLWACSGSRFSMCKTSRERRYKQAEKQKPQPRDPEKLLRRSWSEYTPFSLDYFAYLFQVAIGTVDALHVIPRGIDLHVDLIAWQYIMWEPLYFQGPTE